VHREFGPGRLRAVLFKNQILLIYSIQRRDPAGVRADQHPRFEVADSEFSKAKQSKASARKCTHDNRTDSAPVRDGGAGPGQRAGTVARTSAPPASPQKQVEPAKRTTAAGASATEPARAAISASDAGSATAGRTTAAEAGFGSAPQEEEVLPAEKWIAATSAAAWKQHSPAASGKA